MSKLLCLGHAPLPDEESRLRCSGHLRTWQMVKPLLEDGHEIRLVAARVPTEMEEDSPDANVRISRRGRLHYFSADLASFEDPSFLQTHHDRFQPDAIIGINNHPASRAVRLQTEAPIWCDLNGWAMAEAQAKAATYEEDAYLSHFWNMERAILDRADRLSTVSLAQKNALIGELACVGRLSRRTLGYEFCDVVPNALPELGEARSATAEPAEIPGLPENAFVLLWAGGYNTWADVGLLADVLERAMAENQALFFLSTGGALPGHDTVTFKRFRRALHQRGLEGRAHFTGWVPNSDLPSFYAAADLGLNVDKRCYEATFGARNRINDMVARGLPVLTTITTEISLEWAARGMVLGAEPGDADLLAERIDWAFHHRDSLAKMAEAARESAERRYSFAATTSPLLEWAKAPRRAPDRGAAISLKAGVDFFSSSREAALERAMPKPPPPPPRLAPEELWLDVAEGPELRSNRLEQRLESITGSTFWRLWMLWHGFRRISPWTR